MYAQNLEFVVENERGFGEQGHTSILRNGKEASNVPLLSQIPSENRKQSENLVRTRILAVAVSIQSNYQ